MKNHPRSLFSSYLLLAVFQVLGFLARFFSVHNIRVFALKFIVTVYIILWLASYFYSWYGTLNQFKHGLFR